MMKRAAALRSIAVYTTIATVGLGLTACAGSKQNSNSNTTGGNASTSTVLTIQGDSGDPTLTENFNPFTSTQLEGTRLIYEPLEIPSSIDGAYTPFLASANSFSDPRTLMFTLRSGVKWSDGQPMTAADVVFTFNLLKKFPALDTTGVWTQLSTVTGTADTVTMTFKTPSVPFASTVAQVPIVPEHLWKSIADPAKYTDTKPVGTVHAGVLRPHPIPAAEEQLVLASRQDRAHQGQVPGPVE